MNETVSLFTKINIIFLEDTSEFEGAEWFNILEEIDKALLKYDLDTTACAQRAICWYVKESTTNIEENQASSFDHLVNVLSR